MNSGLSYYAGGILVLGFLSLISYGGLVLLFHDPSTLTKTLCFPSWSVFDMPW